MTGSGVRFALACLVVVAAVGEVFADEPALQVLSRGIGRKFIDKDGKVSGPLAEQGYKQATSLAYQIELLDEAGTKIRQAKPGETFQIGQRFRLRIETDSNVYLYVLHEGPDRERTILVPNSRFNDQPLLSNKGTETLVPPTDGEKPNSFVFEEPAGTDKLLVLASPDVLKPDEVLLHWNRLEKENTELRTRLSFGVAALKTDEGTMHIVGSKDDTRPRVFVEIPLTSKQ